MLTSRRQEGRQLSEACFLTKFGPVTVYPAGLPFSRPSLTLTALGVQPKGDILPELSTSFFCLNFSYSWTNRLYYVSALLTTPGVGSNQPLSRVRKARAESSPFGFSKFYYNSPAHHLRGAGILGAPEAGFWGLTWCKPTALLFHSPRPLLDSPRLLANYIYDVGFFFPTVFIAKLGSPQHSPKSGFERMQAQRRGWLASNRSTNGLGFRGVGYQRGIGVLTKLLRQKPGRLPLSPLRNLQWARHLSGVQLKSRKKKDASGLLRRYPRRPVRPTPPALRRWYKTPLVRSLRATTRRFLAKIQRPRRVLGSAQPTSPESPTIFTFFSQGPTRKLLGEGRKRSPLSLLKLEYQGKLKGRTATDLLYTNLRRLSLQITKRSAARVTALQFHLQTSLAARERQGAVRLPSLRQTRVVSVSAQPAVPAASKSAKRAPAPVQGWRQLLSAALSAKDPKQFTRYRRHRASSFLLRRQLKPMLGLNEDTASAQTRARRFTLQHTKPSSGLSMAPLWARPKLRPTSRQPAAALLADAATFSLPTFRLRLGARSGSFATRHPRLRAAQPITTENDVTPGLGKTVLGDALGLEREHLIPQVRYKPGMGTYWRYYRRSFIETHLLFVVRQWRLTRLVAKLGKIQSFSFIRYLQQSLGAVAQQCQLSLGQTTRTIYASVRAGLWAVNGLRCPNPYFQLYVGDIVSLSGSGVRYLEHSALLSDSLTPRGTVVAKLAPRGFLHRVSLPHTSFVSDNPAYLEVDELTRTATLIVEPWLMASGSPLLTHLGPYLSYRMYNWKYST